MQPKGNEIFSLRMKGIFFFCLDWLQVNANVDQVETEIQDQGQVKDKEFRIGSRTFQNNLTKESIDNFSFGDNVSPNKNYERCNMVVHKLTGDERIASMEDELFEIEKVIKLTLKGGPRNKYFYLPKGGTTFNNESKGYSVQLKTKRKVINVIAWMKKKMKTILGCIKHKGETCIHFTIDCSKN